MELIIEGAKDSVWSWDLTKDTFSTNIHTKDIFGYEESYIKTYSEWTKLVHEDDKGRVQKELEKYLDSDEDRYESNYRVRCKDGKYRWILSTAKGVRGKNGEVIRLAGSYTDITEYKNLEKKLDNISYYNKLTSLYNQPKIEKYIQDNINDDNSKFAVIYMDVDNFRRINDTWGYRAGDKLLKHIAQIMLAHSNEEFVYAHLSEDNFAIIINNNNNDKKEITSELKDLLKELEEPWEFNGQEIHTTFSIGVAMYPEDGSNLEALLVNADTAMWHIKEHGKDGICFYNKDMQVSRLNYIQTANQINLALDNNEFRVYYQPQVELISGKIMSFEALIRWEHPKRGLIPPMDFIPLAEKTGQIYLLFNYVLEEVCRQKIEWEELGYKDTVVSINISGVTLTRDGVYSDIKGILEKYEIDGSTLKVEVTETAIMTNLDTAVAALNKIKELGIKVSLDDFGTGYSSLTYLHKLPIDAVKIDREFIKNIKSEDDDEIIVKIVVYIAEALELEVVAEGVETKEQLSYLLKLKCMQAQGYFFARPVPAKQLNGMLENDFRYCVAPRKVYAVRVGRETGIFNSWDQCKKQIIGFSGAEYKSFKCIDEAKAYLDKSAAPKEIITYSEDDGNKSKDTIVAYVDGSYDVKTNQYGSGVVILWDGKKQTFKYKGKEPALASMRNVAGEIIAAQKAMEFAVEQKVKKVIIYYDYEGIEKWCTGDWKARQKGTQDYRDTCQEIKKKIKVKFVKIAAHTGDKYNEEADSLAKKAINL